MELDDRIEIRLKKSTKDNLAKAAAKADRKPAAMARIIIENAVDRAPKRR